VAVIYTNDFLCCTKFYAFIIVCIMDTHTGMCWNMTYLIECLPTVCAPVCGHIVKNIKCMFSYNIFGPKGGGDVRLFLGQQIWVTVCMWCGL